MASCKMYNVKANCKICKIKFKLKMSVFSPRPAAGHVGKFVGTE